MRVRVLTVMVFVVLLVSGCSLPKLSLFPESGPLKETTLQGTGEEKILVISVNGGISDQPRERLLRSRPSMVEEVVAHLRRAEKDPQIKALLLKINSPGGSVTASDILYHEISAFKNRTGAKIITAMMNVAASGGYYIALPSDWILAHPTTVTGSIGVIFARPTISGFMEKYGFEMQVSKSGEQKDMGSPFRPPSEKDSALFQSLTDTLADRFLELVQKHRKLKPDQLENVATARIYLAEEARQMGLVDQIGYLTDAIEKAKSLAGLKADARVVTFRHHASEDDNIYNPSVQTQAGGLNGLASVLQPLTALSEPGFYYLWPASY